MKTLATILLALCALVSATGCGDDDGPPSSRQTTGTSTDVVAAPDSPRNVALDCIKSEKGIDATPEGERTILIGTGEDDPRVDFYQSSLEAEAEQFEGRGEGAEQIGAALFYVREAPEEMLIAVEDCLNEQ